MSEGDGSVNVDLDNDNKLADVLKEADQEADAGRTEKEARSSAQKKSDALKSDAGKSDIRGSEQKRSEALRSEAGKSAKSGVASDKAKSEAKASEVKEKDEDDEEYEEEDEEDEEYEEENEEDESEEYEDEEYEDDDELIEFGDEPIGDLSKSTPKEKKKKKKDMRRYRNPKFAMTELENKLPAIGKLLLAEKNQVGGKLKQKKYREIKKTVFSQVSKEILNKYNQKITRFNDFNKDLAYSMMINDNYLYRISEKKNDKDEIYYKYQDFMNRNKELVEKKNLRLQAKTEELHKELNSLCTGMPKVNNPVEKTRTSDKFFKDQLQFKERKKGKVEELKQRRLNDTNKELKEKPTISKKSEEYAKSRNIHVTGGGIFMRLATDHHNQKLKHFLNQEKMDKKKIMDLKIQKDYTALFNEATKPLPQQKLKKDDLDMLCGKLHKEGNNFLSNRKKQKELENKQEDDLKKTNLVTSSTNKIILDRFLNDFEVCMTNFFFTKKDYQLNFEEFANLLYAIGFIIIPYDAKILEENEKLDNKPKKAPNSDANSSAGVGANLGASVQEKQLSHEEKFQRFKRKIEAITLKDAWKILSGGKPNVEKIDSNQLLVFCASILGLYLGDFPEDDSDNKDQEKKPDPKDKKEEQDKDKESPSEGKEEVIDTKENEAKEKNSKEKKIGVKNSLKTPRSPKSPKNVPINYAFGSTAKVSIYTKDPQAQSPKRNIQAGAVKSSSTVPQVKKDKKNLIKSRIPEFEMEKYSYHIKTVKQIHSIFHQLYVNRVEWLERKKKEKAEEEDRKRSASAQSINLERSSFTIGNRSIMSAKRWRSKIIESVKNDYSSAHSGHDITGMDQIYETLKRKKLDELAKKRIIEEEDEVKGCTFQPNLRTKRKKIPKKFTKESALKLYEDGSVRLEKRTKGFVPLEVQEYEKNKTNCIFYPETLRSDQAPMYESNPLSHDQQIKKQSKRYERARIQNKLGRIQKEKGVNYSLKIKDMKDVLNYNEGGTSLNCSVETSGFKETIMDSIYKQSELNKKFANPNTTLSTIKHSPSPKTQRDNNKSLVTQKALFTLEIKISKTQTEKLYYYPTDTPNKVVDEFCLKHDVDESKKTNIRKIIENRLAAEQQD